MIVEVEQTVNYYGSPEHMTILRDYDDRVFSHCDFSKPSDEYSPGDEYLIRCYSAVDGDSGGMLAQLFFRGGEGTCIHNGEALIHA